MIACVECGGDLALAAGALDVGEIVICPACGGELEVRKKAPLLLRMLSDLPKINERPKHWQYEKNAAQ